MGEMCVLGTQTSSGRLMAAKQSLSWRRRPGSRSTDDACLIAWSGTYSQMLNATRSREIEKAKTQF